MQQWICPQADNMHKPKMAIRDIRTVKMIELGGHEATMGEKEGDCESPAVVETLGWLWI